MGSDLGDVCNSFASDTGCTRLHVLTRRGVTVVARMILQSVARVRFFATQPRTRIIARTFARRLSYYYFTPRHESFSSFEIFRLVSARPINNNNYYRSFYCRRRRRRAGTRQLPADAASSLRQSPPPSSSRTAGSHVVTASVHTVYTCIINNRIYTHAVRQR